MCDEQDLARWARGKVSRRAFGGGAMAAGVAACAPVNADVDRPAAGGLTERMVSFAAPGGTMDGFFVHPADKTGPLVLFWPDIAGLREPSSQHSRGAELPLVSRDRTDVAISRGLREYDNRSLSRARYHRSGQRITAIAR